MNNKQTKEIAKKAIEISAKEHFKEILKQSNRQKDVSKSEIISQLMANFLGSLKEAKLISNEQQKDLEFMTLDYIENYGDYLLPNLDAMDFSNDDLDY